MGAAEIILNVDVVLARDGLLPAALDIRREVYCTMNKLDPARVVDDFDRRAIHFLGGAGERWTSSARMLVSDDGGFEMERYFDLTEFRSQGRCAEINRFAILPAYRGTAVAYAMFRGFYRYAITKDIRYFCIAATPGNNSRMYRDIGFSQVGQTVMYEELGELHDAYVLDLNAALGDWAKRRPRMLEYFLQPIEGIG